MEISILIPAFPSQFINCERRHLFLKDSRRLTGLIVKGQHVGNTGCAHCSGGYQINRVNDNAVCCRREHATRYFYPGNRVGNVPINPFDHVGIGVVCLNSSLQGNLILSRPCSC